VDVDHHGQHGEKITVGETYAYRLSRRPGEFIKCDVGITLSTVLLTQCPDWVAGGAGGGTVVVPGDCVAVAVVAVAVDVVVVGGTTSKTRSAPAPLLCEP
jgi:hypothetical protein